MSSYRIHNARLNSDRIVHLEITDERFSRISETPLQPRQDDLDAEGRLVIPAFVNAHLHVEKSFWRRELLQQPIEVQHLHRFDSSQYVKRAYTVENVAARIDDAVRLAIAHGTCALRVFVDVDAAAELRALEAALQIKEKYAAWIRLDVAAFPQDGVFNGKGTEDLMHAAMKAGADMIGGIPWIERSEAAQDAHIKLCFDLAEQYGCSLNFVVDDTEDPTSRTLEKIAASTIQRSMQGRVSGTQCNAIAFYDDAHAARVIRLVKEAEMTIINNAHVSLVTTQISRQPAPRGCTRLHELIQAGIPVCTAQDDIDDWYYPFGRTDLLEVAQYMAHIGQFAWPGESHKVLDMVTQIPANLLGLDYGISDGKPANLVILDAEDWHSALQYQVPKAAVILKGKIAAMSRLERDEFF